MLLEFSVSNFRSIKDKITFSMIADDKKGTNSFQSKRFNILTSAAIYGHNASGKSNVVKALSFMKELVLNKNKIILSTDKLPYQPFKLSSETENSSSTFEIVFIINNIKYRYGFEADDQIVYSEWLYEDKKGKEAKLFFRDIDEKTLYVNPTKFKEGFGKEKLKIEQMFAKVEEFENTIDSFKSPEKLKLLKKNKLEAEIKSFEEETLNIKFELQKALQIADKKLSTNDNQLFLWKCDQEGGDISKKILEWFVDLNIVDGLSHVEYIDQVIDKMKNEKFKNKVSNYLRIADLGILDIESVNKEITGEISDKTTKSKIKISHQKYDENSEIEGEVLFDLEKDESVGTNKFFAMAGPILDTLENGKILMIDELDASLHPMLTRHLISLFHKKSINKKNAQLIIVTHDVNLLKKRSIFYRDQIWFTEKDKLGITRLTSLLEYKGVRITDNFEKDYLQGKFGGIPSLNYFDNLEV